MESEPILFPKDQVFAGARACLEKVVKAFTFKMPRHNESTDFGERMGNIKDQYRSYLKRKSDAQILQHRDFDAEESKYLRKLSVVFDLERFITELERSSAGPKALIPLKYEMAVTFGLIKVHPPSSIIPSPPIMLDDSIMDFKYIYDSAMPNCFESSLKKLRCLLRFYILVITPNAPLLEETWKAMRLMELVATEEDLLGRIKNALSEVQKFDKDALKGIKTSIDQAAKLINRFDGNIQQDRENAALDQDDFIDDHDLNVAFTELNGIIEKLVQFDFQQFFFLLKASDSQMPNFEKISALIIFLAKTGAGKSTTTQLVTGAEMVKINGVHIQANTEAMNTYPGLQAIVSAKSNRSVTRYCQQIMILYNKEIIGVLDTPGRDDTQCAEVEMSNSISIVRVVQRCKKTIYPVLLFCSKDSGSRDQNLRKDIVNYSNVINKIEENIQGFSYYFTKHPEAVSNQSLVKEELKSIKEAFRQDKKLEQSVLKNITTMTNDMWKKAGKSKVIAIDPLKPNFNEDELLKDKMIKDILSTGGVDPQKGDFLSVNADKEATDKLNAQIEWHKQSITQCIKDGDAEMAIYKLKEIQKVQEEFSKQASGSFFSNYSNLVVETCKYFTDIIQVKVTQCFKDIIKELSRFNKLQDETIKNFELSLQHLKNIDMVKEGGFSSYIKIDSPKELVAKVFKEVNNVVNQFKNINIGDMQWILFFEKILKLAQHFPAEFEGLKNSALKQYQECAHQVLADFNQVFVNENFLVNFKRTQRSQAGKSTLMQSTEQTSDHAKKQRAARVTRDLFGVAQKQNLYPTLIGRSILKRTGLLESPTQIFEKCMEVLLNSKKNLKEQKDANQNHLAIYEYFNYLEKGVDNLVEVINENLIQDIDEKICAVIAQMFRHDARANRDLANQQSSGISSDKDVSFVQASLDMIETFQKIAEKHTITKISKDLLDVFNRVVQDSIEVYKMHSSAIGQQLQLISSESEILEATHFKWRFQQIEYIRQVHQISAKTNEEFQNLQMKIQNEVQTHKTKIRRHLLKLQKPGEHFHQSVEEDIMFEELDQSAQVIRYFGSLLDPDQGTIEYIKSQLKKEFEKIIKNFDTKASLKSLIHPRNWKNIDHVGHMLEEYRHIMRVVNSLELQISQRCALTDSIKIEVEEALKVIQDALKTPKFFMTTKDYNEYSTYFMYLKLAIKNQEVYLPTPELLALAFKLQKWVEDSVMKQYLQLKTVFNYRYSRYLLKEGKDKNHIFFPRPDPIFYDDEEEKKVEKDKDSVNDQECETQLLEVPENDDWQDRLKESCQEVIKVSQVLYYLLQKQLNWSMKNSQLPISLLLSPLLEKENLLELFGHFRKRLLHDYYDGLNLQELWLQHLQEKPFQSLFFYRQQALSALRVADISLGIKDLIDIVGYIRVEENESSPSAYQSDIEEYSLALKSMEKESMTYQTIEEAYHAFKNRELPTLESLYDQGLYKEVATQLEGIQNTDSDKQRMSKYIQNDMEQTLSTMEGNIKDFKIARGAPGEQDGDNLENLIQGTSKSIRSVDLIIQILGDYMIKDQNIKKLEEVLGIIRETFKQIFDEIKSLGESEISSALVQLYQTQILIIRIQHQPKEPDSQSQFAPQSKSLLTLIQQLKILAGNCQSALEELVRLTIKKFEGADLDTGFSKTTLYPKQFFDSLAQLNDKIKGDTITKGVSKHLGETIHKFDEKLLVIQPEEVNTKEARTKALNTLGALRQSALCQADSVSSDIVLKIDNLIEQIKIHWEKINEREINILEAFHKDSPFEIAEILDHKDNKPLITDETLIKVQQKFSEKISGLISDAVKKFGNGQTKANLKGLIEGDIPFIQSFFDHRSLYNQEKPDEGYILDVWHSQFKSQVIDQVSSIGCYAILYIQKQILAPKQTLDRFDEDLIKARKDLKVQIGSFDKALSTLLDINSANTSIIFDGIKDKLASFYSTTTQWITSTVEKWHQSIEADNSQAMMGLVDDLGMNDLNFKEKNFIKALQAEEETDANYLFVRALNNQFYAAHNNERLISWGVALKDKIISINFLDMNVKLNKDDRVTFYQDFEALYMKLASVASKVGEYYYFQDALSRMETEVLEKIVEKVDQLCIMQKASHNVLEDRSTTLNILERKDAQAQHKIFMLIRESFDNLGTLKDTLSILGRKERESINEAQQDFKDKLFGRVAWLQTKSNELQEQSDDPIKAESLKEVAKILLEMQILKENFIIFKGQLQEAQDQILDEYDRFQLQKRNRLRLENLRRMIQGQDFGTSIIGECRAFAGDNMKELAKKLATKSVGMVLKQMTGDETILLNDTLSQESNMVGDDDSYLNGDDEKHLPPDGTKELFQQQPKILLRQMFAKFNLSYQKLLRQETAATFDKGIIVQHTPDRVIGAIKSFQLSQRKWLESDIQKLPELLALIFGLWSLQKPEHLLRKQQQDKDLQSNGPGEESKEDELFYYLNQPHPAQLQGIFRILGAGYNPNEFVKFGEGDTIKAKTFGDSPQALQARIRNNLVQIITGQGKSVTLAVLSIIFALCGFDVHCGCYSNYLSERDFQAFLAMFTQLELKDRIKYGTFDKLCEMEINKDGNLRDIVSNLILENPENKITITRDADPRPQVLLIDEVDVFFQDDFFGNSYMPRQLIKGPLISALTDLIWYYCDRKMSFEDVQETDEYKQACQMFKPEYLFLLEEAVKHMLHDVKGIESYEKGKLIGGKIQYKVGDGWSDSATDGYKTLFAYYYYYHRDASNPGRDSVSLDTLNDKKAIGVNCTKFSYAEGPLSYPLILGLTGTLDTLSTEQLKIMQSVYNLSSKTYAPSAYDIPKVDSEEQKKDGPPQNKIEGLVDEILIMNESQDQMYPDQTNTDQVHYVNEMTIKILETKESWFNFIDHRIEEGLRTKNTKEGVEGERAVIVFFENDVILKEYKNQSRFIRSYDSSKVDVLTEKDDKDVKASKVSNATNQGHITLLTREFGRGTDFKYQGDLVINAGGLLVIQTFYTKDYSEEIQIRGRTRRQGTTGSYELIVQLSDLQGVFDKEFVVSIMEVEHNPVKRYKALHSKRQELFEVAQKNKLQKREGLKDLHYAYAKNVENIKRILEKCPVRVTDDQKQGIRQMLWDLNCFIAKGPDGQPELNLVKALVLIDATHSMKDLLTNAKNIIQRYFDTVCKSLIEAKYSTKIFKLQMAFYRNYSSGMKILEHSEWTGPEEVIALNTFLETIIATGGQGCEAMEIGLLHCNKEIYEPADGVPVSLIYVIGDAPANATIEVVNQNKKSKNKQGKFAWGKEEEKAFGESTTWDEQLERINNYLGAKIPIYSFYLKSVTFENKIDQVEQFFTKIRINNEPDDDGGLLDVNDKDKLAKVFCKYTMRMIAKKNPYSGDKEKLIHDSENLTFI